MAPGPITSWLIVEETMEIVKDFMFLGSKITEDGDCSHEIKKTKQNKTRDPWKKSYCQSRQHVKK